MDSGVDYMKIYVDKKPCVCHDCSFHNRELDDINIIHRSGGLNRSSECINNAYKISKSYKSECQLTKTKIGYDTAKETIMGNCPLIEFNGGSNEAT